MAETQFRDPFIGLGVFLIVIGLLLIALALASRVMPRLQDLPPILYVSTRLDGVTIGTSPIIIIILILVYLLILARH